jgi:hypothetical protein
MIRTTGSAAIVLALAGCGSERHAATPTTTAPCVPLAGAATTPTTSQSAAELTYLTSVKIDGRACTDRVAFSFAADRPGYRVGYVPAEQAETEDGSGRRIPVAGRVYLVVRLEPAATARIAGEELQFTYKGPRRLAAAETRHVREVVKTGDFEAVVTWVIGLDERRPFRIVRSSSPAALTVEIG